MEALMYNGDLPQPTPPSRAWPGSAGETVVHSARECLAIFKQCKEEGRFPGEHLHFVSHTHWVGILGEVTAEVGDYSETATLHRTDDGFVFVNPLGKVVGFVVFGRETTCTAPPSEGVVYIGG